jgi:predicted nuclease with TOPRIM domain
VKFSPRAAIKSSDDPLDKLETVLLQIDNNELNFRIADLEKEVREKEEKIQKLLKEKIQIEGRLKEKEEKWKNDEVSWGAV